jgi:hypothetical protein
MPLVVSIAGRHQGAGMTMNELVSEGMISLMAAAENLTTPAGIGSAPTRVGHRQGFCPQDSGRGAAS